MKKRYMQPDTKSVKIELSSIIAASVNSLSSTQALEGTEETPVNFSRQTSVWGDDVEEY